MSPASSLTPGYKDRQKRRVSWQVLLVIVLTVLVVVVICPSYGSC